MLDIRGPKIRTGMLESREIHYEPGDNFMIKLVSTEGNSHSLQFR